VTGDSVFAEEVVQEVFLAVWRQASRFDAARGGFAGWLFATVHNKAVDAVRREEAVRRRALALQAIEALDASDPPANRPEDAVEERMRGERVRRALRALPDSQREAMTLAYYGGYTQREIATLTMTPVGTVKTRMHRAMHNLRAALSDLADLGDVHGPTVTEDTDTGNTVTATTDTGNTDKKNTDAGNTAAPQAARVRSLQAGEARVAGATATDDSEGGPR
jgi:RNA polymerase sigma factor (sigma-70 family)